MLCISYFTYSVCIYKDISHNTDINNSFADQGKKIWQKNNCTACHQIYQLGGYLGPDLTNTYSLKGPEYIKAFLKNGTQVMPDFNLTQYEMDALTAYLKQIDDTGVSDPRSFTVLNNGTTYQK
ncbi:nitric oxide reductase subunit C [Flavobacterium sp. HSC-32F16]|uniref:c-type cytochrome n=1 Tax=Flavobacterium sp. HSC-32F16 TaxID=2910964 RepID=UPI0020A2602D|nr:nitric oxide reductase subunit C [Flavobacterium sp. HSC-32F16]